MHQGAALCADAPLLELLRGWASRRPDAIAVRDRLTTLTWAELSRAATRGALRLRELGVGPGSRVLLDIDRSVHVAAAYFAVHAAGAICVIAGKESPDMVAKAADCTEAVLGLTPGFSTWAGPSIPAETLCGPGPEQGTLPEPQLESIADILFTTGTTGAPKGVVLTHSNIASAALNICTYLRQNTEDVEVSPLPLSHSFGLGRLRCAVHAGSTLIIEPGLRGIGSTLDTARQHRVTGLAMTPAGLAILRRARADKELTALAGTLRFVELGSAPITPEVRAWAVGMLGGVRLCHHYGLTEASRAAFVELASKDASDGSIGRPAPNVFIDVLDSAGQPVPAGESGELWVRGAMVARKYWRQPELSAATFRDGAVKTGDLGHMDSTGRLFLSGRLSDLISVGGIKIAPEEVEAMIAQYPDVEEVACAAVADPAGITGERVAAFVVASREIVLSELVAWMRARGVESHRIPVSIERKTSLPRGAAGKLDRKQLAAHALT